MGRSQQVSTKNWVIPTFSDNTLIIYPQRRSLWFYALATQACQPIRGSLAPRALVQLGGPGAIAALGSLALRPVRQPNGLTSFSPSA